MIGSAQYYSITRWPKGGGYLLAQWRDPGILFVWYLPEAPAKARLDRVKSSLPNPPNTIPEKYTNPTLQPACESSKMTPNIIWPNTLSDM